MLKSLTMILVTVLASYGMESAAPRRPFINRARTGASIRKTATIRKRHRPTALPIINDDFERARAEATTRKLPLFVEVWAPW